MAMFTKNGRGYGRATYRRHNTRTLVITLGGMAALRRARVANKAVCSCGAVLDLTEQAFSTCIDCMLEVQPC